MLFGMLIIYLLGVCLMVIVGLFADDAVHSRGTSLAWRATGALLWPVVLPLTIVAAILTRLRGHHER